MNSLAGLSLFPNFVKKLSMLRNKKAFSSMYRLQRTFSSIFYVVSVIALYAVIGYILIEILHAGGFVIAASIILYLVIAAVFGSFLSVISYIPSNLAGAFDPVKNDIANRRIKTSTEFAQRLVQFLTGFFNFVFLDVSHCMVRIGDDEPIRTFTDADVNLDELMVFSRESYEIRYLGKSRVDDDELHGYLVPIYFGEECLGSYTVFTRNKLWRIFVNLLGEFENMYLDDQLIHVLDYQILMAQKGDSK